MKQLLLIFLLTLSATIQLSSQVKEKQIASTFENLADTLSYFFESKPILLNKTKTFINSATGVDFRIDEFVMESSSFDVQKTESIISPYIGHINLNLFKRFMYKDNVEEAVKYAYDDSYYGKSGEYNVKFIFSFQDEKWVFKKIIHLSDGTDEFIIATAFGKQSPGFLLITEPIGQQFNQKWLDLVSKIKGTYSKSQK